MEHSCGAVVFTRTGEGLRFVIVRSLGGDYGFPKGHMEPGETREETALREVFEETGLRVRLLPGFCEREEYEMPRRPGHRKEVFLFLAEYADQTVVYQKEELKSAELMTAQQALASLRFPQHRQVLRAALRLLGEEDE